MHLSKKAEYALRATINLGIATEVGRSTVSGAELAEVTLRKMRRDGIVPPFATAEIYAAADTPSKRKADPADGFLAGLSQLAIHTTETHERDHF